MVMCLVNVVNVDLKAGLPGLPLRGIRSFSALLLLEIRSKIYFDFFDYLDYQFEQSVNGLLQNSPSDLQTV